MVFPYDFGFFPDTRGPDGDPLDVLILCEEPTFPGCQIACRLIGVLKATQKDKGHTLRNDRLIAVAQASVLHASLTELAQLEPGVLKQIEEFFINYQKVRDIEFTILAHEGAAAARAVLAQAILPRHPPRQPDSLRSRFFSVTLDGTGEPSCRTS